MKTPFGTIQTEGRPRRDPLYHVERSATQQLGDRLIEFGRELRAARIVGDVLAIERKIKSLEGQEADLAGASKTPAHDRALDEEFGHPRIGIATPSAANESTSDLQTAFILGLDKCRELHQTIGGWPSLRGRVELAQDAYPDNPEDTGSADGYKGAGIFSDAKAAAAIAGEVAGIFDRLARVFDGGAVEGNQDELADLMRRSSRAMGVWAASGIWLGVPTDAKALADAADDANHTSDPIGDASVVGMINTMAPASPEADQLLRRHPHPGGRIIVDDVGPTNDPHGNEPPATESVDPSTDTTKAQPQ